LDENIEKPEYQKIRKKQNLKLSRKQISKFVNKELLNENIKSTIEDQICICDMYLVEYRLEKDENYFDIFLDEKGNSNVAKVNLMNFLNEIITE